MSVRRSIPSRAARGPSRSASRPTSNDRSAGWPSSVAASRTASPSRSSTSCAPTLSSSLAAAICSSWSPGTQSEVESRVDHRQRRAQLAGLGVVRDLVKALEHPLRRSEAAAGEPDAEDSREHRHEHGWGDEEDRDLPGQLRRADAHPTGELQGDVSAPGASSWSGRVISCPRPARWSSRRRRDPPGGERRCRLRTTRARCSQRSSH